MSNSAKPGIIILVCGILGLIFAGIEQLIVQSGYYFNELTKIDPAQLVGAQIITIIMFLLLGCVLAAINS